MSDWKSDKRYRVEGIHIPEDKAFVFELKDFEELSDFRNFIVHRVTSYNIL